MKAKKCELAQDRLVRVLRRLSQEGLSFPWFDCSKPYDFPVATEEQMRWLNSWKSRWTQPHASLSASARKEGP